MPDLADAAAPAAAVPSEPAAPRPTLAAHLPAGVLTDADEILARFLDWVSAVGLTLYPAQEEAILEVMAGRHVILNTPTGSGKSLVAQALHFKAMCEAKTSYYTSPIKALASEKFFALCDEFGAERVGMLTGDASINPGARVLCCTAEVLSNMALRRGELLDGPYAVMDEFHYYSDPERGVAWQVPLMTLRSTQFLLMSATLGNVAPIAERVERDTGRKVAVVTSSQRPVPLEFEYRETPLHETVQELLDSGRAPVYVVNFTQRECAELAQSLTSLQVATREERDAIRDAVGDFRFDTPYGKEFRRFISFGLGVHHAGLLPKYRLLVEQLAQKGLLKVISGTDTLGVGVNIPIRTVLFSKLAKFGGDKVAILTVRDFLQIAGRAGRKGFDERGWVVAQAPEHVVEKKKLAQKAGSDKQKRKALAKKKGPAKGDISWTKETFDSLIARPPEMLVSRFQVTHGMVLMTVQRDAEIDDPNRRNFHSLREVIARCHDDEATKRRHLRDAAARARSLARAGVLKMQRDTRSGFLWVVVDEELQAEFALHQALSLYLVEALDALDAQHPDYAFAVLALVEAILEDPRIVLLKQADRAKQQLLSRLKAEGVPYEERIERLEEITHTKPEAEFIYRTFELFREAHPWVGGEAIRPKGVGREIYEGYLSFADFVRANGLERSEGVLLRYLSQLYKTLAQSVPERAKTEGVYDLQSFLRTMLERVDTSLIEEWESMLHPELALAAEEQRRATREELRAWELLHDPKAFTARVRAELHQIVRALSRGDWEDAAGSVRADPDDPWPPERFEAALAPFVERYGALPAFTPEARQAHRTRIDKEAAEEGGGRRWRVRHTLVDPEGEDFWAVEGVVDLASPDAFEGPLITLRAIGEG
jgi:hypothetical protein